MNDSRDRQKIAIIGSGISGLGAAYMLAPYHDITIYEKNAYVGGHSRTIDIRTSQGVSRETMQRAHQGTTPQAIQEALHRTIPVDTGFIVFNYRNYPLLTKLFDQLGVPVAKSNMSFGVSIGSGFMEYSTSSLSSLFAQKINFLRPSFWRMLVDILRFNRFAYRHLEVESSLCLGDFLNQLNPGAWFRDYFLLAMGSAIWSASVAQMLAFPSSAFIRFFANHGLLTMLDQPQWYTVQGGSRVYVERLIAGFREHIRLNCPVTEVVRGASDVIVYDGTGLAEPYDAVVFACHADQALHMIKQPTEEEKKVLGKLAYQPNRVVVHSDTSFMPKRKSAWASWVYLAEAEKDHHRRVSLSYWMNNLQPLDTDVPVILSLNPGKEPAQALIYDEYWFDHPVFDQAALDAQTQINALQGKNHSWFCGAYQRYGFHEDGLLSAVNMLSSMGIRYQCI